MRSPVPRSANPAARAATAADSLTLQLLESLAARPRPYAEAQETWRTSCPRLSIWEDACMDGLIACDSGTSGLVRPSAKGLALLRDHRPEENTE
jgi:hypothetical protein